MFLRHWGRFTREAKYNDAGECLECLAKDRGYWTDGNKSTTAVKSLIGEKMLSIIKAGRRKTWVELYRLPGVKNVKVFPNLSSCFS